MTTTLTFRSVAIGLLAAAVSARAQTGARSFALDDLDALVRLQDPALAPDGRKVALVVGRANLAENRYDRDLVLVDARTGEAQTLLRERRGLSDPQFSPRGDALAFLAEGAAPEGALQVFVVAATGGEPRALTSVPSSVDAYAWRPDGQAIAFSAADPAPMKAGADRFLDAFEVGKNGVLDRAAARPSHLYVVAAEGGEARRLTRGGFSLATGLGRSPLSWSPDGRFVAFTRTITPRSGDSETARLHVVDMTTGAQRRITLRPGPEQAPVFSPDGKWIAFLHPRNDDPANATEVLLAPAGGGDGLAVSRGLDRSVHFARYLSDGSLLLGGNDGTRMGLWRRSGLELHHEDAPIQDLSPLGLGLVVEYADVTTARGGTIAFVGTERDRPAELYVLDAPGAAPRRLTDFHAGIASLSLGRTEGTLWPTDDGLTADGVLTYPPDFTPGRAWPLVLVIHGGPTAASNESFDPLAQLLAARGFLVLQPNYRGSDNRGNAFQRAISAGAGEGPGRDVMAGVELMKKRGYVDASRIAVSGWSYGGFMTGWLLGRYPEVWRAGAMGAAALDLFDMWSLSDLSAQRRHAFTTSPWVRGREAHFAEQSPLTHVANVRAPTLILSNVSDARVAISQSYKFFRALQDNDVTTRFFAYPTGGHTPVGPVRQKDVYRRWRDWIAERFAGGS